MIQASDILTQDLAPAKFVGADSHSSRLCDMVDSWLPPLDEITVGSAFTDDSSSVSSISSNEDLQEKPRSIFKAYWDKNGGGRTLPQGTTRNDRKFSPSGQESSSANTYERTLKHQEMILEQGQISPGSRRRIFGQGCWSQSSPSLYLDSGIAYDRPIRKTRSASLFAKQPKSSCLRQSKYSGGCKEKQEGSDHSVGSVSFRNDVDVLIFQKPVENYAADGWSNWFA